MGICATELDLGDQQEVAPEDAALRVTVPSVVDKYFSRRALWGTKVIPVLPFPSSFVSVPAWSTQLWEEELEKWDNV